MTDNVRKVFDILGVKPNEEFKIDNVNLKNHIYFIDERLEVFDEKLNDLDVFLKDLLNGTYEIIKLPKKKKLRDLTAEEYEKWREKNCTITFKSCTKCPFKSVVCFPAANNLWLNHKDLYSDKFLNQEIEVKENE